MVEGSRDINVSFKDIVDGENGPVNAAIEIEKALELVSQPQG